jgi:hypothetical protein
MHDPFFPLLTYSVVSDFANSARIQPEDVGMHSFLS